MDRPFAVRLSVAVRGCFGVSIFSQAQLVRNAVEFPGANLGEKIHAAALSLPNGGTVDATALTGPQTITTDIFFWR